MKNPHELQIANAFAEASKELDGLLGRLAYLRARVSAGASTSHLSPPRAVKVPEIARQLSIAITDAEGAQLRLHHAATIFHQETPGAG